ncbi:MAG TPA: hypothetical protein DEF45_17035 [Rhodopirellula sp.]|nr:hypothetical protein [Rhodopirellula sp.]
MHNQVILAAIGSFAAATIAVLLVSETTAPDSAFHHSGTPKVSVAAKDTKQKVGDTGRAQRPKLPPSLDQNRLAGSKKHGELLLLPELKNRIKESDSVILDNQTPATTTGVKQEQPNENLVGNETPLTSFPATAFSLQAVEADTAQPSPGNKEASSQDSTAPLDLMKRHEASRQETDTLMQGNIAFGIDKNSPLAHLQSQTNFQPTPTLAFTKGLEDPAYSTSSFRMRSSQTQAQFVQSGGPQGPGTSGTGENENSQEAETLGVPPPEEKPAFLRERSILLPPGQYQFEYGVRYGVDASTFPVAGVLQTESNQVQIANANQKRRLLTTPMELRIGVSKNLQAFLSMPIGWSSQSLSVGNVQQDNDNIGIGDMGFGLTRVLWAPKKKKLRILGFMQSSAPTGDSNIALTQQAREASLGAGYWTLTSGLNVTETYDPLVLFSSVGFTYTFATRLDTGEKLNAGNTLFYQTGIGYSINSNITVSASFSGASTGKAELNGVVSGGTRTEPFTLRFAGTISEPKEKGKPRLSRTREPFLRFGLTSLANDVEFGMRWTY